jgi:hypothetical protein
MMYEFVAGLLDSGVFGKGVYTSYAKFNELIAKFLQVD